MVFTSILVHGITVPMTKAFMHGVTLTRTLTQPNETVKRKSQVPVTVGDIHRIGVAVPLPTYNGATGRSVTGSTSYTPRVATPEPHTQVSTMAESHLEREVEFAPQPQAEGRSVA